MLSRFHDRKAAQRIKQASTPEYYGRWNNWDQIGSNVRGVLNDIQYSPWECDRSPRSRGKQHNVLLHAPNEVGPSCSGGRVGHNIFSIMAAGAVRSEFNHV